MEDVLPNPQSELLDIPKERAEQEEKERIEIVKSKPVLAELLAWFDEEISKTDSIESIQLDNFVQENDLRVQILVQRQLKNLLTIKRSELWGKIQTIKESSGE